MLTTRVVYLTILGFNAVLNGLALLQVAGFMLDVDGVIPAALLFNLILIPLVIPWAYRMGEMAEEEYRRNLKHADKASNEPLAADEAHVAAGDDVGAKYPRLPARTVVSQSSELVTKRQ